MTAKTITFAVQLGASGFEVARAVAAGLKYTYYDWEVTSRAAREAGVSPAALAAAEQLPSLVARFFRFLGAGSFAADAGMGQPSAATMSSAIRTLSDEYRHFMERMVRELADQGAAVIVGHASQVVLQRDSDTLKVLVCGSAHRRAARLATDEGLTQEAAAAAVRQSDQDRIRFFKRIYHVDLLDASLYDLTLNTDYVPPDSAADIVLSAAATLPGLAPERVIDTSR